MFVRGGTLLYGCSDRVDASGSKRDVSSVAALHKSTQLYCCVGKSPVMHIGYRGVHLPWFDDMAFVFPYNYS